MKRHGNLFDLITTRDNLTLAYYRASRGKRFRIPVRNFGDQLDCRMNLLGEQIRCESFVFGRYEQFLIQDPKERVITAPCFEERVCHHAIMNICEPIMDRWLIADTYACRRGRGRDAAIRRALEFSRSAVWCLKLDVRKYFDSVCHDRLLCLLERQFKDHRLLAIFGKIIQTFRGEQGRGLPIGSLMSQHFANFYLGWLDRFIKEDLKIRGYVRYMDDLLIWTNDHNQMLHVLKTCEEYLATKLFLQFKPARLVKVVGGVDFLGCRVFPTHVELNRRSKQRWRLRVTFLGKAYRLGLLSANALQRRIVALTAFGRAADAKSWKFRRAVLQKLEVNEP